MPRKQKTKDFFINSGSSCYTEPFISLLCGVALTHLLISLQKNASIPSWTSWSEKDQLEVKKANDSWLSEEIGDIPPYKFSWGEITSVYNQREGSSYIAIKYY